MKKKLIQILLSLIVTTIFMGFITVSAMAKSEGTLGENPILNFLADYLSLLAIPVFWTANYLADETSWINTTYYLVSAITISLIYVLAIDRLVTIIYRLTNKKTHHNNGYKT